MEWIPKNCSLGEVLSWQNAVPRLSLKSSMGLFSEGVLVGNLASLPPAFAAGVSAAAVSGPEPSEFFDSIFKVAIVRSAGRVEDDAGRDVKEQLWASAWSVVADQGGVLGNGPHVSLVSVDPIAVIPKRLKGARNAFPLQKRFGQSVMSVISAMGRLGLEASDAERHLISFLYEAAHNSFEHARVDPERGVIRAVRGISFEKLVFSSLDDVGTRDGIEPIVRGYLSRTWPRAERGLFFTATVSDAGPGIHRSLAALPGESDWARLCRAFEKGTTRKAAAHGVNFGLGLHNLINACRSLEAFIFVRSGSEMGFVDFANLSETALPESLAELLRPWPSSIRAGRFGTSLSILWPLMTDPNE